MLDVIEKLLILQDRDRKILRVQGELNNIGPERRAGEHRLSESQTQLEAAKQKLKQIETERNKLELEAEAKKQLIDKYSVQQFQTRKNEEYRALSNEIESCKKAIRSLEDQQLDLMEKAEALQVELAEAAKTHAQLSKTTEEQLASLKTREEALKKELSELQSNYTQLTAGIEESALNRYQRIRKLKGANTIVGVDRSVCGGCHMKLPIQVVVSCQAQEEIVCCPNCGRILYYTPHMDLAVAD
jgi:uncharacterized protein